MIEYGLLIATVTVVVLLGMASFGNQVEPWVARLAIRITIVGR
jgi:Flp pilus assembly pilin Flp